LQDTQFIFQASEVEGNCQEVVQDRHDCSQYIRELIITIRAHNLLNYELGLDVEWVKRGYRFRSTTDYKYKVAE
jgi:hypothetical protein